MNYILAPVVIAGSTNPTFYAVMMWPGVPAVCTATSYTLPSGVSLGNSKNGGGKCSDAVPAYPY